MTQRMTKKQARRILAGAHAQVMFAFDVYVAAKAEGDTARQVRALEIILAAEKIRSAVLNQYDPTKPEQRRRDNRGGRHR
jgi:hypothetical protein